MSGERRIGLALGSGAARGFAHIGVLQVLQQEGIGVHCIAGTSIGAVIGVLFAAGVSPDDLAVTAAELQWKQLAGLIDPVLPTSGLIDGGKLRRFIQALLPVENFDQLQLPVAVTATDVQSGKPIIIRQGRLLDALQAAIAFPGIFNPVRFGDRWLIDGGLCHPVPTNIVRSLGADKVIGVCAIPQVEKPQETFLPPQQEERRGRLAEAFNALRIEQLFRDIWHSNGDNDQTKPPNLFRVAAQSIAIMENRINDLQLQIDPPELLLRPPLPGLTLLEFQRAGEAVDAGRREARAKLAELRALVAESGA